MKTPEKIPQYTITRWIFLILLSFIGCKDSSTSPADFVTNAPVTASVTNVFTYVIAADDFTAGVNADLTFTTDSLVYSAVVSNFGRGSFTFTVGDLSGKTILRDSVFTTKVNAVIQSGKGIPSRCSLNFQNFTGSLNLALTSNQVKH